MNSKNLRLNIPGIILIDKPAGKSSAAVIATAKRSLNLAKIGHAGTLDPMATGLLVCMTGKATRLADFAQGGAKQYSGQFQLGVVTDSDDITGTVITSSSTIPDFEKVRTEVIHFTGDIIQFPPRVSAIKVDGQRAYNLSRENISFELQARKVNVSSFEIWPTENVSIIGFRINCSKGTYIRSIARDLGQRLGCGACLKALRREVSAPFSLDKTVKLENLQVKDIQHWQCLFPNTEILRLSATELKRLSSGDQRFIQDKVFNSSSGFLGSRMLYCGPDSSNPQGVVVWQDGAWKLEFNMFSLGQSS